MPTTRRLPITWLQLLLLLAVLSVGACTLLPPGVVPASLDRPLVTYETRGGECPEGPCGFHADIYRDGRVTRSDGMAQVVDAPSLRRLIEQVDRADFDAILAVPFEGECPVNVDGQEELFTFDVGTAPVVVASCTTLVDHTAEPFQTVLGILFGLGG